MVSLPDNEEENDTEVDSHEEDGMKQVLPSSAVLQQAEQPQQAKKDEKVTMDDLWGFKDRNVVAKDKPGGENGIAEVENTLGGKEHDMEEIKELNDEPFVLHFAKELYERKVRNGWRSSIKCEPPPGIPDQGAADVVRLLHQEAG